jgi:hypothetical protein
VNQPTFNHPASLFALSGVQAEYSVQPWFPNVDGTCTIQSVQEGDFDGMIFVYRNTFNPNSPLTGLIAMNDDDGDTYGQGTSFILEVDVDFSDNYYLVTSGYGSSDQGQFANHIFCGDPVSTVVPADGGLPAYDGSYIELLNGRFRVNITWTDFSSNSGNAKSVPLGSNDSGVFWFFNPANFEVLIKVINACGFNNRYWVFMAATTNVGFTVNVRDQVTGITYTRTNPLGTNTITDLTDTNALATCP